jgi:hypothetical protein
MRSVGGKGDVKVDTQATGRDAAPPRVRFRIQSLMWVIAFIAFGLALSRWLPPFFALPILIFPASVLAERFFGGRPKVTEPRPSVFAFSARVGSVVMCGCVVSVVAWYGSSRAVPTILSPMPLLVTAELIVVWWIPNFWIFVFLFASGSYLLMNLYQLRRANYVGLPSRFVFVLSISTVYSVCHFAFGWQYGVRYQGTVYTVASALINLGFLLLLWTWWYFQRRSSSAWGALGFATVLHAWLFWFAIPYLGELP